jgi:hypothetical protein
MEAFSILEALGQIPWVHLYTVGLCQIDLLAILYISVHGRG